MSGSVQLFARGQWKSVQFGQRVDEREKMASPPYEIDWDSRIDDEGLGNFALPFGIVSQKVNSLANMRIESISDVATLSFGKKDVVILVQFLTKILR